jgi:Skp family chaperone for outer membrane proteins
MKMPHWISGLALGIGIVAVLLLRLGGIKKGRVIEKVKAAKKERKEIRQHKKLVAKEIQDASGNLDAFIVKAEAGRDAREKAAKALVVELEKHQDSDTARRMLDVERERLRTIRNSRPD